MITILALTLRHYDGAQNNTILKENDICIIQDTVDTIGSDNKHAWSPKQHCTIHFNFVSLTDNPWCNVPQTAQLKSTSIVMWDTAYTHCVQCTWFHTLADWTKVKPTQSSWGKAGEKGGVEVATGISIIMNEETIREIVFIKSVGSSLETKMFPQNAASNHIVAQQVTVYTTLSQWKKSILTKSLKKKLRSMFTTFGHSYQEVELISHKCWEIEVRVGG